jgi:hypothetical protein
MAKVNRKDMGTDVKYEGVKMKKIRFIILAVILSVSLFAMTLATGVQSANLAS